MEFMQEALKEAKIAFSKGEVPVGAIVVLDGEIIGRGHNLRETENQAILHAEIIAITEACKKIGSWRLENADIYVTLEPCPMCAGAIINSRIRKVYFSAYDEKTGCLSSKINLFDCGFNHRPHIRQGLLEQESMSLLKTFFEKLR